MSSHKSSGELHQRPFHMRAIARVRYGNRPEVELIHQVEAAIPDVEEPGDHCQTAAIAFKGDVFRRVIRGERLEAQVIVALDVNLQETRYAILREDRVEAPTSDARLDRGRAVFACPIRVKRIPFRICSA